MLHKFSAWTHLSNFDQSQHKNWTKLVNLVRKVKSNWHVFPACKNWLNFSFRGQFEIKILMVRHVKNKHISYELKKIKLEPAIIWKLVTCQRITSKRYSTSIGRHLSPRYGQVILVSGYPFLTAVNWSQHWCAIYVCNITLPVLPN